MRPGVCRPCPCPAATRHPNCTRRAPGLLIPHAPRSPRAERVTPRHQGFDIAKKAALEYAAKLKIPVSVSDGALDRDVVSSVARTALRTKLHMQLADQLTDIVVDAVAMIRRPDVPLDLHMVEVRHGSAR